MYLKAACLLAKSKGEYIGEDREYPRTICFALLKAMKNGKKKWEKSNTYLTSYMKVLFPEFNRLDEARYYDGECWWDYTRKQERVLSLLLMHEQTR